MKFIEVAEPAVCSDDLFYDLFDGGYIKPAKLLVDKEDVEKVQNAINIVQEFLDGAIEADVIEVI